MQFKKQNPILLVAKIIGASAIAVVVIGLLAEWSQYRDSATAQAASLYEKCVFDTYRQMPAQWYADHGSYPDCEIKN